MNFFFACLGEASRSIAFKSQSVALRLIDDRDRQFQSINGDAFNRQLSWYAVLAKSPVNQLLHVKETPSVTVILIGEIFVEKGQEDPAHVALRSWSEGGITAVGDLDGCFSAMVCDTETRTVEIVSDRVGRRCLRFFCDGSSLLVSTHDLALVATGQCPVEVDLDSAASLIAMDWSPGNRSCLRGVSSCLPAEYLRWDPTRKLTRIPRKLFSAENRVDRRDTKSHANIRNSIVSSIVDTAREITRGRSEILTDLTAGLDSRASLAVLLSVLSPDSIRTQTSGGTDALDVRVAKEISSICRVQHFTREVSRPVPDDFLRNSCEYALFSNGTMNSKRAMGNQPLYDPDGILTFGGGGGEIYRGYYYPRMPVLGHNFDAYNVLRRRFRRMETLRWLEPSTLPNIQERLRDAVLRCEAEAESPFDVLDRFYLFERYRCWALGVQMPMHDRRYTCFESIAAIQLAFELPSPIGDFCRVHGSLIRTLLPNCSKIPINGNSSVLIEERRVLQQVAKIVTVAQKKGTRFVRKCLKSPATGASSSNEDLRSALFSTDLFEPISGLLLAAGSISRMLFGEKVLRKMLDDQRTRATNHLQSLGFMVTLEQWLLLMKQAYQLANTSPNTSQDSLYSPTSSNEGDNAANDA